MRKRISMSRMPNADCLACHGIGAVRMTAHFYTGDQEWEAPCWECFGNSIKVTFPSPKTTDN
jgi:DnaJ-class molecular chaperone